MTSSRASQTAKNLLDILHFEAIVFQLSVESRSRCVRYSILNCRISNSQIWVEKAAIVCNVETSDKWRFFRSNQASIRPSESVRMTCRSTWSLVCMIFTQFKCNAACSRFLNFFDTTVLHIIFESALQLSVSSVFYISKCFLIIHLLSLIENVFTAFLILLRNLSIHHMKIIYASLFFRLELYLLSRSLYQLQHQKLSLSEYKQSSVFLCQLSRSWSRQSNRVCIQLTFTICSIL